VIGEKDLEERFCLVRSLSHPDERIVALEEKDSRLHPYPSHRCAVRR